MDIAGRRILVTGATGGIGAAIVSALAARGARLVVTGRRAPELEAMTSRVGGESIVADLVEPAGVEAVESVLATCDAVVLNAGVAGPEEGQAWGPGDLEEVMTVNLLAPMRLARAFVAGHLPSGRPGAVVFTGSVAGVTASPGMTLYNASKFGLRGFALSLAHELAGTSLSATHLCVGFVRDAGMLVDSGRHLPTWVRTRSPASVADAVVGAITAGPPELWVAPTELRLAATVSGSLPGVSGPLLRRVGSSAWRRQGRR